MDKYLDPLKYMRSVRKFGRDMLVAVIGVALVLGASAVAGLGLSEEMLAISVPVSLLGWRLLRDVMGRGPEEG